MATDPRLNEAFRAATGVPIVPVWGSTETTGIALACPVGEPFPLDSIGRPCPHYEVRLVDEAGLELAVGATGEMLIRGPAVMAGYAGDAAGTAQALAGGWYHTGDLATADADGFYYFRGRRTSMIKVGGLKVFSEEVEAALERHPAVREAAVVPVAQELRGEVHRAYLVAATGETRPSVLGRVARRRPGRCLAAPPWRPARPRAPPDGAPGRPRPPR